MKKMIALFIIFCLFGCSTNKAQIIPDKENITVQKFELGQKKTDIKPVILINNDKDTLYIGETDFNFDIEGYSDNGKIEITYDDSAVNYDAQGTYNVKVLVSDTYDNQECDVELLLKKKPVIQANTNSGNTENLILSNNNNSGNNGGCRDTCFGKVFCSWAEVLAYADEMHSIGMLSDRNWEEAHSYNDWPW